jgi:hypothetical protein
MTTGRKTGRVLQVVGVVGLVVCILAGVGVVAGRAWVGNGVDQVKATADQALERGSAAIEAAEARLTDRASDLAAIRTVLGAVVADAPLTESIRGRVAAVADGYANLREGYADARAQVAATLQFAQALGDRLPGVRVPDRAAGVLATVDQRLTEIDARVLELRESAATTVGAVTGAMGPLETVVTNAAASVRDLNASVDELQATVDDASASVHFYLWLVTGGILLFLAWIGLLNVLVIWLARRP